MLPTEVFVNNPVNLGSGEYRFELFFFELSLAKYLNVGDRVKDSANNEYEVTSLANTPHTDGGEVTTSFVTSDTLPQQDSDYDSTAFTPGQEDVRPKAQTAVSIENVSVFDAQNYEYEIVSSVEFVGEADKLVVGDSLVDIDGKEFQITFIDTGRFDDPFRAKEVHEEGIKPKLGVGTLYTPTSSLGLFRGTPISDPARTVTRNRDNFVLDDKINELESSVNAVGDASELVKSTYSNDTGNNLDPLVAVGTNSNGNLEVLDVSSEASIKAFKGITVETIPNASSGEVGKIGKIKDISTSFNLQAAVYVAKDGTLTSAPPAIGVNSFVEGDFVFYIGHVAENEDNDTQVDLELRPQLVGQL